MSTFDDCWQRIARAEIHKQTFGDIWEKFTDRKDAYTPLVSVDDDGAGRILIEPESLFGLPPTASLELGEMLYQLRATLDGSVYTCAVLESGQNPPPDEDRLEFPVYTIPDKFNENARKLGKLAKKQRDIIESVQPYDIDKLRPDTAVRDPRRNLWLINEWARKDRHRRLHFIGSRALIGQPKFTFPDGVSLVSITISDPGFLENESQIAEFRLDGWVRGMKLETNFDPHVSIDVAVEDIPPQCAPNDTTWNRLTQMLLTTRCVIQWLEESF